MPGIPEPLHIFEERYKSMIDMCISEDRVFGIVYFDGEQMRNIGCSARVEKIIERYADGRLDIIVRGEKRFTILALDESKPYLQGWVNFFDDQEQEPVRELMETARRGVRLLNELNLLAGEVEISEPSPDGDPVQISFLIAGNRGFSAEERQHFLEMRNTRQRLLKSIEALKTAMKRATLTREIHHIIGGNGNLGDHLRLR